jgi:putative hydrolase of the HAD superfamily
MIVTIISFDLDGTLVTDEFTRAVWHQGMPELYAEQYRCSFEQAQELLLVEYNKIGDDALEWYDIQHWFRRFKLRGDWKSLLAQFTHHIRTYPEVHEVLEQLGRRYQLMITSNAAREFLDMEIEATGISAYFMHVISATSDFQHVKKNRAFYRKLCRQLDIGAADLVHVGDHYRFDYLVPGELGIKSFYLDRSGNRAGPFMVGDLKEFMGRLEV